MIASGGYCLDTSALINPWRRMWPRDLLPGYWGEIARLAAEGQVVFSEEVRDEIERKDDELLAWARANIHTWHPLTDEIQACVREIMDRWGRLVDHRKNHGSADPFVIATARVRGLAVVTDEGPGSEQRPQIPYVCQQLSVPCLGLLEFVREARVQLR